MTRIRPERRTDIVVASINAPALAASRERLYAEVEKLGEQTAFPYKDVNDAFRKRLDAYAGPTIDAMAGSALVKANAAKDQSIRFAKLGLLLGVATAAVSIGSVANLIPNIPSFCLDLGLSTASAVFLQKAVTQSRAQDRAQQDVKRLQDWGSAIACGSPTAAQTPTTAGTALPVRVNVSKTISATLCGSALCGAVSAAACGTVAGALALLGVPVVGAAAVTAAAVGSALFGATLLSLTVPDSFNPPPGTDEAFKSGRQNPLKNLPFPKRDAASLVLAAKTMWDGFNNAVNASDERSAARCGGDGCERIGEILGHGAVRTSAIILGGAIGMASGHPWVAVPLCMAAGFGAGYAVDRPGHWLGRRAGRLVGSQAARRIYRHPSAA